MLKSEQEMFLLFNWSLRSIGLGGGLRSYSVIKSFIEKALINPLCPTYPALNSMQSELAPSWGTK